MTDSPGASPGGSSCSRPTPQPPSEGVRSQGTTLPPGVDVPETLTYTFWLNDEQLPVRIVVDMGGLGGIEMRFSGWGVSVDIQAPPASQITDQNPFALTV